MDDSVSPLSDICVLDCTQMLSGPFASQLLADLGAEVIKIERPEVGDITRSIEPTVGNSDMTGYFASLNRGKRSVELDLSSTRGAAAFLEISETTDIIIENYRPGTMEQWGLGYENLRALNDELIYCSISGFLPGPYRDLSAFDMVVQALGGSMSITGETERSPMRPGLPIGDLCASMYAVISIVTALFARSTQGGQYIDVPMFEGLVSLLAERAGRTFATGEPYPRLGTAHPSLAPYRAFETTDGWLALAVASEGTWKSFCHAIERPDLTNDERFETNTARVEHREDLSTELEPIFAKRSAKEWFDTLREHNIPAAPVNNTVEVFEDPHLQATDVMSDLTIDEVDLPFIEFPVQFSEAGTGADSIPPELGQHTYEVLSEVLDDCELMKMNSIDMQ